MKLALDMYHPNTFHIPKCDAVNSVDITLGRGGAGALTPIWGGASCWNQVLPSDLHPYCKQNHTFLLLAESIIFLHSHIISIFIFFGKILQHLKINPGSTPDIYLTKSNPKYDEFR